jgi:RecB family exonuclease
VDYRDRGMLVHSALELLWKRLGGSQELRAAYGPQLDAMINECVSQAMADAFAVGGIYQEERSTLREHRRTGRLIRNLCEVELQRPPFRISELEAERRWTSTAGSTMRLRIDRIDELEDGTFAIFDYKSGAAQSQDWTGDRVSHPQLLTYMLASGANVSAIAMAQLTPVRVGFKGITDRKGRLPRVSSLEGDEASATQRWEEQKIRWRGTIERLAADFVAGSATIDPMRNACRICHLHAFCRIADIPTDDDVGDE